MVGVDVGDDDVDEGDETRREEREESSSPGSYIFRSFLLLETRP